MGITGPTGGGKSTLTQLIPRFYDTAAGKVIVDGQDVRKRPLKQLRQKLPWFLKRLFCSLVRFVKTYNGEKKRCDRRGMLASIRDRQSRDFVEALPQKLDTPIFEGGKNFSGGQKQRLTIARAIIAKPDILILDDSLSALDYQTDLDLRMAFKRKIRGTIIIISQRVRSIQDAQQILVLDQGNLVAKGTHDELMITSKAYQEIVASQEEEEE